LAAGAGLFATLTILLAGILEHNTALILAAVPLGAALLGFLRYNFNPATAFLGDSGSLLLGFLLGCFGVIWRFKTATVFGMIAPLMAMSVPILDATLAVARRFLRGRPIFGADRGHVHHRLLDRGHTHRRVVLLLYGACAFGAVLSLLQSVQRDRYSGVVIFLFCAGTWICIRRLGYAEFRAVRSMVFGGVLQRTIDINVQLREFETALESCVTVPQWWAQLCDQCRSFGFASAKLNFGGQVYQERFVATPGGSWNVVIGLADGGSLLLTVPRDARRSRSFTVSPARERRTDTASARLCSSHSERTASTVMPFVDLISKQLPVGMRVAQNEPAAVALSAQLGRHNVRTGTADSFDSQPFEEQFLEDSVL
jgi:UDP-GlcNAc:undecaprenyl-phosphate GlcNAc-1-phosphate transferase